MTSTWRYLCFALLWLCVAGETILPEPVVSLSLKAINLRQVASYSNVSLELIFCNSAP